VKKKNLPPPPPTALPAVTWAVDKALPPEALKAVEEGLLEWDKQFLSPCGALHMAGNAAEWVADWYEKDAYSKDAFRDPSGPKAGTAHVIRGGSYLSDKDDDISTFRRSHPTDEKGKTGCDKGGRPFVGFRCAKSIEVVRKAAP
jgi:formylglycine-generating enzyme required for sulfatase activity